MTNLLTLASAKSVGRPCTIPFGHPAKTEKKPLSRALPPQRKRLAISGQTESRTRKGTALAGTRVSFFPCPCEPGVPFCNPAFASQRLALSLFPALAIQQLTFSAKRNGGGFFVRDGVAGCWDLARARGHRTCLPSRVKTKSGDPAPFRLANTPLRKRHDYRHPLPCRKSHASTCQTEPQTRKGTG